MNLICSKILASKMDSSNRKGQLTSLACMCTGSLHVDYSVQIDSATAHAAWGDYCRVQCTCLCEHLAHVHRTAKSLYKAYQLWWCANICARQCTCALSAHARARARACTCCCRPCMHALHVLRRLCPCWSWSDADPLTWMRSSLPSRPAGGGQSVMDMTSRGQARVTLA